MIKPNNISSCNIQNCWRLNFQINCLLVVKFSVVRHRQGTRYFLGPILINFEKYRFITIDWSFAYFSEKNSYKIKSFKRRNDIYQFFNLVLRGWVCRTHYGLIWLDMYHTYGGAVVHQSWNYQFFKVLKSTFFHLLGQKSVNICSLRHSTWPILDFWKNHCCSIQLAVKFWFFRCLIHSVKIYSHL